LVDPTKLVVYRSSFDRFGFCDLKAISGEITDPLHPYRVAYRRMWLDDLGGFDVAQDTPVKKTPKSALQIVPDGLKGLDQAIGAALEGQNLIRELVRLVDDKKAPASALGMVSNKLTELDRNIEQLGYHIAPLGPLTRMFVFAKENITGSDAHGLASQMNKVYQDLERRGRKLGEYYTAG